MFKATKKVYMSILAILLVFITVVATTYAWVGILTYAQTDTFQMNLKTMDLDNDYYLSISTTGEENDFSDTANSIELKKQIIKNMGYDVSNLDTDAKVEHRFGQLYMLHPATTTRDAILNDEFHELDSSAAIVSSSKSSSFYKFDIYISMEHREGDTAITSTTNVKMDLILADIANTLTGELSTSIPSNDFTYPSSDVYNPNGFNKISGNVSIDSASAARLAFAIYDPINRSDNYLGSETPSKLLFYQGGTQAPTYDSVSGTYSFGGILPEEYNIALYEHKINHSLRPEDLNIPIAALNRGDLEFIDANNSLIDGDFGFGIFNGTKTKIKITTYFWFEGWDADCFEIIDAIKVKINISLTTGAVIL